ncbi:hypothetical protein ml_509 [Mollivirus sibericum]|uniref:hypothetical protein n=1 Tax=Mollivirus sibericum TaxID=1678078 RepID=UPI0006B2E193|nr:hypothetical protein ml_509 [Mollivirus sibericum]ALD62311.1 hypothetical protein ml_509 [Mollivirus sibericum]
MVANIVVDTIVGLLLDRSIIGFAVGAVSGVVLALVALVGICVAWLLIKRAIRVWQFVCFTANDISQVIQALRHRAEDTIRVTPQSDARLHRFPNGLCRRVPQGVRQPRRRGACSGFGGFCDLDQVFGGVRDETPRRTAKVEVARVDPPANVANTEEQVSGREVLCRADAVPAVVDAINNQHLFDVVRQPPATQDQTVPRAGDIVVTAPKHHETEEARKEESLHTNEVDHGIGNDEAKDPIVPEAQESVPVEQQQQEVVRDISGAIVRLISADDHGGAATASGPTRLRSIDVDSDSDSDDPPRCNIYDYDSDDY